MATAAKNLEIRAVIASDALAVDLWIPAGFPAEMLTLDLCKTLLQGENIPLTSEIVASLQSLLASYQPTDKLQRTTIARAIPPQDGKDGWIDWIIERRLEEHNLQGSHYERSAYLTVKADDLLGQIHPPTFGADGVDVIGHSISAKPGKPVTLKLDDSVSQDSTGRLIAQKEGILVRKGDRLTIRQRLEIPEYIDFSTGNIDFAGDVLVSKGIRDLFQVVTAGNLEVRGLIEAATLTCGGDLLAEGGMAARGRGALRIQGDVSARYLDNVNGEIKGNLRVEREAINCNLIIHGAITAPTGMIIGGRLVVVGAIHIGTVGSPGGTITELVLGTVPALEPFADNLAALLTDLQTKFAAFDSERKMLDNEKRRLTSVDRERQTELLFEISSLQQNMLRAQTTLDALNDRIASQRTIELSAHRIIHAGSTLIVNGAAFRLSRDLHGPIKILKDRGDLIYQLSSGDSGLLAQVADVKTVS